MVKKNSEIDVPEHFALGTNFSLPINFNNLDFAKLLSNLERGLKQIHDPNQKFYARSIFLQKKYFLYHVLILKNINYIDICHDLKTFLKNNPGILVSKVDKGNVIAFLNKNDYFTKLFQLISVSDETTYRLVENNPTNHINAICEFF